ncbi:MAG TPA: hypothetical protein VFC16_19405 [Nakamurella sp.]|nr:hypothetical protein [Nakamurella sp.]
MGPREATVDVTPSRDVFGGRATGCDVGLRLVLEIPENRNSECSDPHRFGIDDLVLGAGGNARPFHGRAVLLLSDPADEQLLAARGRAASAAVGKAVSGWW